MEEVTESKNGYESLLEFENDEEDLIENAKSNILL